MLLCMVGEVVIGWLYLERCSYVSTYMFKRRFQCFRLGRAGCGFERMTSLSFPGTWPDARCFGKSKIGQGV